MAPFAAASRSASAKTTLGDLPPSSIDTRLTVPAAARRIAFPVSVSPVNEILSMPGCSAMAAPTTGPGPGTTWNAPGGSPASARSSANISAVRGVTDAGLRTTVFPRERAGAIFHMAWSSGKFQGVIAPTTPTGSRRVRRKASLRPGNVSP